MSDATSTASNASTLERLKLSKPPFGAAGAADYLTRNTTNSFVDSFEPQKDIGQALARQASTVMHVHSHKILLTLFIYVCKSSLLA